MCKLYRQYNARIWEERAVRVDVRQGKHSRMDSAEKLPALLHAAIVWEHNTYNFLFTPFWQIVALPVLQVEFILILSNELIMNNDKGATLVGLEMSIQPPE